MINRVLIRMKVVQTLYSYLLTEREFSLEPQPSQPTKEKRFAYQLYLDMLTFMVQVADDITAGRGATLHKPLKDNRFITNIEADEILHSQLVRQKQGEKSRLQQLIPSLAENIKKSGLFKLYVKLGGETTMPEDVKVWREIFNQIIWSDKYFNEICSGYENYSMRGMDRAKELIENTFSNFLSSGGNANDASKQLLTSLQQAQELQMRLLALPIAITDLRDARIDAARHKIRPTAEDLNPDMHISDNKLVAELRENVELNEYLSKNKINWVTESPELIASLLKSILASEIYEQYILEPDSMQADCNFWRKSLREIIYPCEEFLDDMESKSVFWNDDLFIMGDFALKTIRRFEEGLGQNAIQPMYKDDEDAQFGPELLRNVMDHKQEYRALINATLDKQIWETDRLAFMDIVILLTAIAELLNFPMIPIRVTVNEYLEIAKEYSTSRSASFINGVLAGIIKSLQKEGKLLKQE